MATASKPIRRMAGPRRRDAILDAAASLLADRPVEAVSMSDIVRHAGVSRPVVYDHFRNKQQLVVALIVRHHRAMIQALSSVAVSGGITDEQTYREVLGAVFEHFESDPAGWRLLCDEPSADPAVAEVQRVTRDEVLALTLAALRLPASELAVVEGLRNATNGLFGWGREHPEVTREQLIDAAVSLTWRGLGG